MGCSSSKSRYMDDDGYVKKRKVAKLKEGDHIAYPLAGHMHHAIVTKQNAGKGQKTEIIHLVWEREATDSTVVPGKVVEEEVDLKALALSRKLLVFNYGEEHCFPAHEVVSGARKRLGSVEYDVENYNSEHFARQCKYGRAESNQPGMIVRLRVEVPVGGSGSAQTWTDTAGGLINDLAVSAFGPLGGRVVDLAKMVLPQQ